MFDLLLAAGLHRMVLLELGVSIGGLLVGLSTLALPSSLRVAPVVRSCAVLLGVVLASLELVILKAALDSGMSQPFRLAVMVAGLVGWEILVLHAALASGTRPAIGRWRLPLGLLAATITLYTWIECRHDAAPPGLIALEEVANRDLVVKTTVAAYTDQNFRIPVYVNLRDHALDADAETMLLKRFKLVGLVTRTAAPDARCNCHGWIFTGGRFWVKGTDVGQVLHDNRYEEVSETRVGDLIVYRDDAGKSFTPAWCERSARTDWFSSRAGGPCTAATCTSRPTNSTGRTLPTTGVPARVTCYRASRMGSGIASRAPRSPMPSWMR